MSRVTDPALLDALNGTPAATPNGKVTDPAILEALAGGSVEEPEVTPEGGIGEAIVEPLLTAATASASSAVGGVIGAAHAVNPFLEEGAAENAVRQTQEDFTYIPKTQAGQDAIAHLGERGELIGNVLSGPSALIVGLATGLVTNDTSEAVSAAADVIDKGLPEMAASKVLEKTDSPALATAVKLLPELAVSYYPVTRIPSKNTPFKQKVAQEIQAGGTEKRLAQYIVTGSGKVKSDKAAIAAIKQGFDESVVAAIKGSTRDDRMKMERMVKIMQKGKNNALYLQDHRPSDIAGDSLLSRVNYVKRVNKTAGNQLDRIAKGLKGKPIDSSPPINNFISALDDMGVRIGDDLKPIFDGSDIDGLEGPQKVVTNIVNRLAKGKPGETPDAYDLHRMKRYIDENVDYGKSEGGLTGRAKAVVKNLRHDIDSLLDESFPKYNRVNTTYSDTISAINSLQDVAGRKMNLDGAQANKAVGTLLRRLMGNAQSRVNLSDAVTEIDLVARQYGGKFNDNIKMQMLFADELDNVFGPSTRTSFKAEIGKEVQRGVADAVTGAPVISPALRGGVKLMEKAKGISPEKAAEAILRVLRR